MRSASCLVQLLTSSPACQRYAHEMQYVIAVIIGMIGGLLSGLFGIGGGIVMIPAMVLALSFTQHQAQGTSLAVLSVPVVALGAWKYWQQGHVNLGFAALIAAGFVGGVLAGSQISLSLDPAVAKRAFSVLLVVVAIYMWFSASPKAAPPTTSTTAENPT